MWVKIRMAPPFRYRLSDAEKDALLSDQAALIEAQATTISDLQRRIAELEAGSKPKKTSRNSSKPPSSDMNGGGSSSGGDKASTKKPRKRRDRPGVSRRLAETPDETVRVAACACGKCGADVSGQRQSVRHRYDHIDIPPVVPHVTRVELLGGRCAGCGSRFKAPPPEGMTPGTPSGRISKPSCSTCITATMSASSGSPG
jgi:transposase